MNKKGTKFKLRELGLKKREREKWNEIRMKKLQLAVMSANSTNTNNSPQIDMKRIPRCYEKGDNIEAFLISF